MEQPKPEQPQIVQPSPTTILLQVSVDSQGQLGMMSSIPDKKALINLLVDLIKMVNNHNDSNRIITPK